MREIAMVSNYTYCNEMVIAKSYISNMQFSLKPH